MVKIPELAIKEGNESLRNLVDKGTGSFNNLTNKASGSINQVADDATKGLGTFMNGLSTPLIIGGVAVAAILLLKK